MGQPKLLMNWCENTVIETVLQAWRQSRVDQIVVVARRDDHELIDRCCDAGAEVVTPIDDPPEIKISVQAALNHVESVFAPSATDVWLLAPADMPRISATVIDRLVDAHDAESPCILVPESNGLRGHPVLFPWPLAKETQKLAADEGVNALLKRHHVREIAGGDLTVLEDLDTPGDYRRLSERE